MLKLESFKSIKVNAKSVVGGLDPNIQAQPKLTYSLTYYPGGGLPGGPNMDMDNPGGNP
ncbi:MAG: hypothetical protein KA215_10805 [Flavobacterium sp.]|nr:hypothetical protein [Flavobacterium sp.]